MAVPVDALATIRDRVGEAAVILGTAGAVVSGLAGWGVACAVFLVVSVVGEPFMPRRGDIVERLLRVGQLGSSVRVALRFSAVMALVLNQGDASTLASLVLIGYVLFALMAAVTGIAMHRVRYRRNLPVETRNIDTSSLLIPDPPSRLIRGRINENFFVPMLLVLVPACIASDSIRPTVVGGAIAFVLACLPLTRALLADRRTAGLLDNDAVLDVVRDFLAEYEPEVLLYFADSSPSIYQVNMWLSTIERLERRAMIVMRSRRALVKIGATSLPVLCVPSTVNLISLDFAAARAALYVGNNGPNLHLLRLPHLKSAFIGHGDSDKNASVNPYAKVYDELWTAGPAGRDRWRLADIGIDDADIVEVGRPQLHHLAMHDADGGPIPTLLYAPTWEGWNLTQEYGSVAFQGLALVRAVLDSPVPVRLIYKPHPLTGRRDPRVRDVHQQIIALIDADNHARGLTNRPTYEPPDIDPSHAFADAAQRTRHSGEPGYQLSAIEAQTRTVAAQKAYLASLDPQAHLVAEGPGPDLFAYFGAADFLVTDISSVLSDFQATDKPYAVCNTTTNTEKQFIENAPAAAAGIVIGPDGERLDEVIAVASRVAADTYVDARQHMRTYLLGDRRVPAQQRFADAVDALVARAGERAAKHSDPPGGPV